MSAVLDHPAIEFRPMSAEDLAQVIAIDRRIYPYPWTESIFRDCLHVGYCCWVMEENEKIVAYGVLSIGVADEAHILNISVQPESQRRGLGESMLDYLLDLADDHKAKSIFLEVRPSNTAALNLYDKKGFNRVGVRTNYYPTQGGREDALILAFRVVP